MNINPNRVMLACLCNDEENVEDYKVDGNKCFYKDEYIGKFDIKYDFNNGIVDIFYKPIKKVEYITLNITISPTGAIINE